ncbi:DUF935 domain-containing protein [Nitratidesulfovibrio vulgaris]|uniref:DUF935 domain-containing protein n=1 Tax=Nitratidesulfovibrio vulgaris TaxID=881 RepID=UPI0013E07131|nr:DUF935 domain-containing protein [Nitratidesulfovibrio vulgaris]
MYSIDDMLRTARGFVRSFMASGGVQTRDGDRAEATANLYWERWGNAVDGLTPARLRSILQAADDGDILRQHLLFADMEDRCDHLAAELSKRKRALLTLDWEILPGRAADAKAQRVADAVREQFDALANIEDLMLDMADGIGHGFAALEIQWGREGRTHLPQAFHFRPQAWFQTAPEDRNTLRLRDGTAQGATLQPFGWVLHTHRSRSGWLPRAGLFRVLAWSYLIRAYALAANASYVEVHGLPFRLGKYPQGSNEEDKAALRRALQCLGRDASGIIPQGMDIIFQTPANSTHDHFGTLMARCEQGMSKAILGGTLTSQADGKTSTNALGNIHNEMRHDLLVSDALQIAGTLSRQVLAPLAILNEGVADARLLPWFRFDTREAEDLSTYADALPKLAGVMRIPARWAHEKLKIPQPEGDEEVLRVPGALGGPRDANAGPGPEGGAPTDQGTDQGTGQGADAGAGEGAALTAALAAGHDADPEPDADFPDQQAVDAIDLPDATLQAAMEELLAPLMAELQQGTEPGELLARLGELYPTMPGRNLEELLARALFVSEVWGRVSAAGE